MVYDALGREVKELIDGDQNAGYQSIAWNSTNRNGNVVSSGMYFYRIEATSLSDPAKTFTQVNKMLLIK
jgi:flagellar hook assembly protein FlgD